MVAVSKLLGHASLTTTQVTAGESISWPRVGPSPGAGKPGQVHKGMSARAQTQAAIRCSNSRPLGAVKQLASWCRNRCRVG
jgi:hypothetical protein